MNEHTQHLYKLLMEAGDKFRAFQMYEIGAGHGAVADEVNQKVTQALVRTWDAIRTMEQADRAARAAAREEFSP